MYYERKRLGEMLRDAGILTEEQLEIALEEKKRSKERLGKILVDLGFTTEGIILDFLGSQMNIPHINLDDIDIQQFDAKVRKDVLEGLIRRHLILPIIKEGKTITVAMADPLDVFALDDMKKATGCDIKPVIATESMIRAAIERVYGREESTLEEILKGVDIQRFDIVRATDEKAVDLTGRSSEKEAPIIKLANHILLQAITVGASDIHLEPYQKDVRLRYRIDGILHEFESPPKSVHAAIVSRIKIIGNMDIAEHRLPQDGRAKIIIENREADLRISIIPTVNGEKVVIRVLDPKGLCVDMAKLGFEEEILRLYTRIITSPYGIILITGPTGSGKSTTLYSTLRTINATDKNIITMEDPVEYMMRGINQVQARPDIGLDFTTGLRSFMRQDPDIILVGEIRDRETAEVAINAALTGHLVFATLHTNDAAGAVTRLVNMGIEPFLITSTIILSVAQRLIRRVCPKCGEEYEPSEILLKELGVIPKPGEKIIFKKGQGCGHCSRTGYRGRLGVFEVMQITDNIKDMILAREASHIIKEEAANNGMITLEEAALRKVMSGQTTSEELIRVAFEARGKLDIHHHLLDKPEKNGDKK
ncbi:Flp pilus assembly complex ATPase component TadA [bacterium]|nr:Flp pilus assembly complex ATPase component TadA [bacterium]MBU1753305.1 Flp pilus assembly complex ATPase component TadA [bacterium]